MNVMKTTLNPPTRGLSNKYTMEVPQDIKHRWIEPEFDTDAKMQDILRRIDAENQARHLGWHPVRIPAIGHLVIPQDWCDQHLRGAYVAANRFWYFELDQDAVIFALRWS
jgi:hypothetical protein